MFIDIHVHVVSDCEMPVLFHVATRDHDTYGLIDDFGLPRFEEAVRKFPGITWLCHSQAWWSFISGDVGEDEWGGYPEGPVVEGGRVVELMRRYPNVYGDLSAGSGFNAVSRDPAFGHWFMNEFQDQPPRRAARPLGGLHEGRPGCGADQPRGLRQDSAQERGASAGALTRAHGTSASGLP